MARWKLVESHYLNTIGADATTWEYKETDRSTGRERRKTLDVPRLLDINDPACWTWSEGNSDNKNGEIIVCHVGKGQRGDIEFRGDPTPGMVPADDEAREISAGFAEHWRYKPETAEVGFSQSMFDRVMAEKAEMEAKPQQVEVAGLSDLLTAFAAMQAQNQQLIMALSKTEHRKV
jgi:hypothetical protein